LGLGLGLGLGFGLEFRSVCVFYLQPANPLGHAKHKYCVGAFYYAIINLDPEIRMGLPYIQLACVAFESDISLFGMELVVSGSIDEPLLVGSSIGASMRRLDAGMELNLPDDDAGGELCDPSTGEPHMEKIYAWVCLICADYPAAAKLGCWMQVL
jgi:hypothetical protein